jgi:hypothetical protein
LGKIFADAEYLSEIYLDCELIDGKWYFEDSFGGLFPFIVQERVKPYNLPQRHRRHSPERAGQISDSTRTSYGMDVDL